MFKDSQHSMSYHYDIISENKLDSGANRMPACTNSNETCDSPILSVLFNTLPQRGIQLMVTFQGKQMCVIRGRE